MTTSRYIDQSTHRLGLLPKGFPAQSGLQAKDEGEVRASLWTKEGDVIDTAHGHAPKLLAKEERTTRPL